MALAMQRQIIKAGVRVRGISDCKDSNQWYKYISVLWTNWLYYAEIMRNQPKMLSVLLETENICYCALNVTFGKLNIVK